MLLTKIARQFQSLAISIAAVRYGTTRGEKLVVLSESRRVQSATPGPGRSSMLSFSLFMTMTAIFAGVFLIAFGRLEVPRENPLRSAEEPDIQRTAPAPSASVVLERWASAIPERSAPVVPEVSVPTSERLSPEAFTLVMGGFQAMGQVIDGDTLAAGPKRIRLQGIDAPEIGQSCHQGANSVDCGSLAAEFLVTFLSGHHVTCRSVDIDRYKRQVATCFLRNGTDVNRHMVASGWAIAYRRYSRQYEQDETFARTRRSGIWAGSFVPPEDWRVGVR